MASIKKIEGTRGIKYQITVSNGYDSKGKKIRKKTTFIPDPNRTDKQNQKALERFVFEFETSVIDGIYYDGENMTLKELSDKWLAEYAEENLTPKTVENYTYALNSYIIPNIGHLKIAKIKPLNIQSLWKHLKNDNVRRDGKNGGLRGTTLKKYHNILSKMFTCAVQWGLIESNPCNRVAAPKIDTQNEENFFTPEQAIIFLNALEREYIYTYKAHKRVDDTGKTYTVGEYTETRKIPLQFQVFFNIALFGGLRCGEVLALTWNEIDFENKFITVARSVSYANHKMMVKEPKTKSSRRTITMPDCVMRLLRKLKMEQNRLRLSLGTYWNNEEGYLFTQDTGKLMFYSSPYAKFKEIIHKYNADVQEDNKLTDEEKKTLLLPNITLHGLRHTSATLLISENVDTRTVSARLGHAQPSTTLNIYAHAIKARDEIASNTLENMLKVK